MYLNKRYLTHKINPEIDMRKKIVITGATGLIGAHLIKKLEDQYDLILLTRNPNKYTDKQGIKYTYWDGQKTIPDIINGTYAIINLIGENIGDKRWTESQKRLIVDSRVKAAQAISESIKVCVKSPQIWIQASATGYYGQSKNQVFDESSNKGCNSFLADVCQQWEEPISALELDDIRKVIVRTGVVLAPNSDLWKQLTQSFSFGIAAVVGTGRQILPWIHIEDEVGAIKFVLNNPDCSGCFNLVAPSRTSMREVINEIKSNKKTFLTINVPRWLLSLIFGKERTDELILTNQDVIPKKLFDKNFNFKYENIHQAVENLLAK